MMKWEAGLRRMHECCGAVGEILLPAPEDVPV